LTTPRKRWVKQPTSLLREPWPIEVRGTLAMLSCWLGDRWARDGIETFEEASSAVLSRGALQDITGRKSFKSGVKVLQECATFVSLSVQVHSESVSVSWPRWAKEQQDASRSPGAGRPRIAPSKTQTQTQTQTQKEEEAAEAPAALTDGEPFELEPEPSPEELDRARRIKHALQLCPKQADPIAWEVFVRANIDAIRLYQFGKGCEFAQALMSFWNRKRSEQKDAGQVPVGGRY
jgi:hypothetical protein